MSSPFVKILDPPLQNANEVTFGTYAMVTCHENEFNEQEEKCRENSRLTVCNQARKLSINNV